MACDTPMCGDTVVENHGAILLDDVVLIDGCRGMSGAFTDGVTNFS